MTEMEICRNFLQAKDRKNQIKVLSELALLPKEKIINILRHHNIDPAVPAPKKAKLTGYEFLPLKAGKQRKRLLDKWQELS